MIRRLRIIAFLEGVSLLVLLFIAMPLKYIGDDPRAVEVVGMAHGLFFIAYCFALLQVYLDRNWSFGRGAFGFIASFLPFGTFVFDRKLCSWEADRTA